MSNTVRLYHFFCDHWGFENVRERRLKLSCPNLVNDIFELRPFDFGNGEQGRDLRYAWGEAIKKHSISQGFISFSDSWTVPTMWGHYADSYKGVCLGFDLPICRDDQVVYADQIDYVDELHPMDERVLTDSVYNLKMQNIAKKTKSSHWAYEQEWRYWFSLSETEMHKKLDDPEVKLFADFDNNLILKEVIFGPKSKHTTKEFSELLNPSENVKFTTARPSFRKFAMVPQRHEEHQK